jgi:anti-sigma factor RsiW
MVERQDIDALLIGSLYGELSSTEEARLTAHLESHPADRTALADLTRARTVVRESRMLQVQFDPPQSISALLMQEAARRAPKPRDEMGWLQRFMRSVLLHPAMAAAAMLVLIIGVAGTVYLRQGDHFARQTKDEAPTLPGGNTTADQPVAATVPVVSADAGATEQFRVGLDQEGAGGQAPATPATDEKKLADRTRAVQKQRELSEEAKEARADKNAKAEAQLATKELAAEKKRPSAEPPKTGESLAKTAAKPQPKSKGYIEVTTPDQRPKDFDGITNGRDDATKHDNSVASAPGAAGPKAPPAVNVPSPAPPPPAETEAKPVDPKPDPVLAWAKEQHGKAVVAAKKDCKLAANIAMQIANRAPAYYAANIENDRALKSCQQYIAAEREKELERANRAKATQRRAVDEAPAPAKATTK